MSFSNTNSEDITLLCCGYLRRHIDYNFDFKGIASILLQYYSFDFINNTRFSTVMCKNFDFVCDFRMIDNKHITDKHCGSTIIFTPFLSQQFALNVSNKRDIHCAMEIKLLANECNQKQYKNLNGYKFQCGVICISKDCYVNIKSNKKGDKDKSKESILNQQKESVIAQIRSIFEKKDLYKKEICYLSNISQMDETFNQFKSCYIEWRHSADYYDKGCTIHCDKTKVNLLEQPCYNKTDVMHVIVTKKHTDVVTLSYHRNKKLLQFHALDSKKYDFLYAIASKRCDCDPTDNVEGFKFGVSIRYN